MLTCQLATSERQEKRKASVDLKCSALTVTTQKCVNIRTGNHPGLIRAREAVAFPPREDSFRPHHCVLAAELCSAEQRRRDNGSPSCTNVPFVMQMA